MRALTVKPGVAGSARLDDVAEPSPDAGEVLVRARALGICGTDVEIVAGLYGQAPVGEERLILGHESLGVVEEASPGSGFSPGESVVGIVRRPDPIPCSACAEGEWDMCHNGLYTERGIKERHGYGSERWRVPAEFAVKVDPALGLRGVLLEPASVVAKAWAHVDAIGGRSRSWRPRSVLVTGAGPVGLLAALMGAMRGLDVHVYDRVEEGPKPGLVRDLGGEYHKGGLDALDEVRCDVVMECTGAPPVILRAMAGNARGAVVCLTGVSSGGRTLPLDVGGLNRTIVLENDVVFGSVNANRSHYESAARDLAAADGAWLDRIITRREPLADFAAALERRPGDVKTIVDFAR